MRKKDDQFGFAPMVLMAVVAIVLAAVILGSKYLPMMGINYPGQTTVTAPVNVIASPLPSDDSPFVDDEDDGDDSL